HNLSAFIDETGDRVSSGTQSAQVLHRSLLPEERPGLVACANHGIHVGNPIDCESNHLSAAIYPQGDALISTFRSAEVGDLAIPPEDGVDFRKTWNQGIDFSILRITGNQTVVGNP